MCKDLSYHYSGTKGHIISVASSLPSNPNKLLGSGWEDISNPNQKAAGHWELKESSTGLKIRYDEKKPGASGFAGKDHYHIYNPDAKSNKDLYLDINGNPIRKGHKKSHILPKGDD